MKKQAPNSSRTPIYREAGFELYDAKTMKDAFLQEDSTPADPELFIYSRYRNPTVVAAEKKIMELEKCKWSLLTQSGMSAIDIALSIFQKGKETNPWLFFTEIYGGTNSYIDSILIQRRGLNILRLEPKDESYDLDQFERMLIEHKPELVFFEILSNPLLIVTDVKRIINLSHKHGSKVIIDNTFTTPLLLNPLNMGADLVIHSATKYLGGHGNLTAGVICGNDEELRKEATNYRKFTGHMISPDDAYRLTTQMESFNLRVGQQFKNSMELASLLENSEKIEKVWFPNIESHKTFSIAKELFDEKGCGAIITFDLAGKDRNTKEKNRDAFISNVSDKIKVIPTLGDSHTILMPVEPVWGYKYPEPGMIRLSVGFEETSLLMDTFMAALRKIT